MPISLFRISLILVGTLIVTTSLYGQDRLTGQTFATRSEVIAENGMVVTHHPLAGQIALDILKQGGSAVDAAIAANAFLGFADPAMNGPGGDLFAMVWSADDATLYGLNASGRSPRQLGFSHLKDQGYTRMPISGPFSITVPGAVDGWFELHDRFGELPMDQLLSPAIRYARQGVAVTEEIAELMDFLERDLIHNYGLPDDFEWADLPGFSEIYRREGRFPVKGERFSNPDYARTLQTIADGGLQAFYQGEIARIITDHIQELGGYLSMEDMSSHRSEWVDPVSVDYRGHEVWQMPPNGQGMAVLQMLKLLEGYDLAEYGFGSREHIHYFTEAKKLAFADLNTYYGDPSFTDLPVEKLISDPYADARRALIRDDLAGSYGPGLETESHTIYLTVGDSRGNMISLIQSNSWLFGSLVVPPGLGFPLQNRGSGFTLEEGHVNQYEPGKRPFHTIIPAFITRDGEPWVSFGLTGGDMQAQGHVQIVMNLIDFGMNIQEAGDAPRIRHASGQGSGDTGAIELESGFSYETIRELMRSGHRVTWGFERFGGYQGLLFDGTFYYGGSDPRKDGQASGY